MDLRGIDRRDHLKTVLIFFRKRALCKKNSKLPEF